jgi:NADH:ubiquinone oxidoreductase subunit H
MFTDNFSFTRFFGQLSSKTMINYFLIFLSLLKSYFNVSKIQFLFIIGLTFLTVFLLKVYSLFFFYLLLFLSTLVPVLLSVAFYTLAERKIMAILQRRLGPNVVGFWGLLQAIADGLKLVLKEIIIPTSSNQFLFVLAPILSMVLAFLAWVAIPFNFSSSIADLNLGVLFLFMLSGLNIYSLLLAG